MCFSVPFLEKGTQNPKAHEHFESLKVVSKSSICPPTLIVNNRLVVFELILRIDSFNLKLQALNHSALTLLLTGFLCCAQLAIAQRPSDRFDDVPFNARYLEHLIKVKVDSVRAENDCKALVNDSILYVASQHHARYMAQYKRLTHDELESEECRTPQLRAEHYGAKNYQVGENALKTSFNVQVKSKKGKLFDGTTYGGLATSIVDGWVNSPGHFRNIITPGFNITGVTVAMTDDGKMLYACQKFALVAYRFELVESEAMFPYSNYVPPPPITDFEGIPNELLEHKHEWGLKHDKPEACAECAMVVHRPPQLTLRFENNQFIFRIENSDYVKELIKKRHDGFAVELVVYEDYMCGNPEYFTKASRRNGQCELNGRVLQPLYRDDLMKGYKKRKTNKEVKFLSYLVKADSVPFFERTYQYKLDRFDSEYFEIKLAKLPKDVLGYWNHNLLYIQDDQICHVDYFTGYCGELFMDHQSPKRLGLEAIGDFKFDPIHDHHYFKFRFEKDKSEFTEADIAPSIKALEQIDYRVDTIQLAATASVDGDSLHNIKLLMERSRNLMQYFMDRQEDSIYVFATARLADTELYDELAKSPQWKHLGALSRDQLIKRVNQGGLADSLEPLLARTRIGNVNIYYTIPFNDQTRAYYISHEFGRCSKWLTGSTAHADSNAYYLDRIYDLFRYTHRMVMEGRLDTAELGVFSIPKFCDELLPLHELYVLYGYAYPMAFAGNSQWPRQHAEAEEELLRQRGNLSNAFVYNYLFEQARKLDEEEKVSRETVQQYLNELEELKGYYERDSVARQQIELINFNLNMLLLNEVFASDPQANEAGAYKSIGEVMDWYVKNNRLSDTVVLQLAKAAVFYGSNELALTIVRPYRHVDAVNAYALPLEYVHVSTYGSEVFYDQLIEEAARMAPEYWCNLFFSECGLPFQAFDHEQLRNTFCEQCLQENDFLRGILE
ncbi:MAG: CAP domain-containing protein [Flavobacteriales bacterium]